jgi:hypothetical protein
VCTLHGLLFGAAVVLCGAAAVLAAAKLVDCRKGMQLLVFLCRGYIHLAQEHGLCHRSLDWMKEDMLCCDVSLCCGTLGVLS